VDRTDLSAGKQTPMEQPAGTPPPAPQYGSDVVAETLRSLALPYIALVPGASFRGLHDSLVNYLGNRDPQMLLCLHEEHAVARLRQVTGVRWRSCIQWLPRRWRLQRLVRPHARADSGRDLSTPPRRPWIDWIRRAIRARSCDPMSSGMISPPRPPRRAARGLGARQSVPHPVGGFILSGGSVDEQPPPLHRTRYTPATRAARTKHRGC
jgi:hypothetical protein